MIPDAFRDFGRDLRRALHDARRRPLATAGAAAMLALGIGLTTALFGAVDTVLLRPLPMRDADRVVIAWTRDVERGYPHFPILDRARPAFAEATTLERVAAVDSWNWSEQPAENAGSARSTRLARVLGDFFEVVGATPFLGRLTTAADALPGNAGVAVISHGLWQRAFGGSADVLGRTLEVGERSLTVVGVLPPGFDYPQGAELWTPMRLVEDARPQLELDVVARLAPGASVEQANAEIGRLLRSDVELAEAYGGTVTVTRTLRDHLLGDVRPVLLVLLAGAALVLLIAIANVAGLLLVRGTGRARELAVRRALGADLRRLLRPLFAEAVVLGVLAATLGVAVAWAALRLLIPLAPTDVPALTGVTPDPRSLAFTMALAMIVVLVCTAAPGAAAARIAPVSALSGGLRITDGRTRAGLSRHALGAFQLALAITALAGAHLLVRSFAQLRALDLGFDVENLHLVRMSVPYRVFEVPERYPDALAAAADRMAAFPGIAAVTPVLSAPLVESGGYAAPVLREGEAPGDWQDKSLLSIETVLPEYFPMLGVDVRAGRTFLGTDRPGAPNVVVVNETTARLLWPDAEAVGQRIGLPFPGQQQTAWTVAGVVADTRYAALLDPRPMLYLPLLQFRSFAPPYLLVRTEPGVGADAAVLAQAALDEQDPRIRVLGSQPAAEILDRPLAGTRFAALVLAIFACVAVGLAAAGVYAVMATAVREQTREFGIRLALGARAAHVHRLVVRRSLSMAAIGLPAGLLAALAGGRGAGSLLFGVEPADPLSLGAAAGGILAVAILASLVPAARAARVDPARTLRTE